MEPINTTATEPAVGSQPHVFASNVSPEFAVEILDALGKFNDPSDVLLHLYNHAERDEKLATMLNGWREQYGLAANGQAEQGMLRMIVEDLARRGTTPSAR